jgi:ATP-dependent Zn protease
VAVHEAGHTIATFACNKVEKIIYAFIDKDNGGVSYLFKDNKSAKSSYASMVICLAGLAGELSVYNKCNGIHATKDLVSAIEYLDKLLLLDFSKIKINKSKADITKMYKRSFSDLEKDILNSAFYDAKNLIKDYGDKYFKLISLLLAKNKISESDIENICGSRFSIKLTGHLPSQDVQFFKPRRFSIIERFKKWANNNLFPMLQEFYQKLTHMLNSL